MAILPHHRHHVILWSQEYVVAMGPVGPEWPVVVRQRIVAPLDDKRRSSSWYHEVGVLIEIIARACCNGLRGSRPLVSVLASLT